MRGSLGEPTRAQATAGGTRRKVRNAGRHGLNEQAAPYTRNRLVLAERMEKPSLPTSSFEEVFEHAVRLLTSPYEVWENSDSARKNAVLRLVLAERVAYDRKNGLRTPKTSFPFQWLSALKGDEVEMVEGAGFEPA